MPPRSKVIRTLPADIRQEVERRILAKRFSDYEGLAEWVREQGYELSEDSLWRYGKSLKNEFSAVRLSLLQARVLAEKAPDHKGRMMQALVQVVQQKLLSALSEQHEANHIELCWLVHAVTDLARVYLPHQEAAAERRRCKKARAQFDLEALMARPPNGILGEGEYGDDALTNQQK